MVVAPVLVTVDPPRTAKLSAEPSIIPAWACVDKTRSAAKANGSEHACMIWVPTSMVQDETKKAGAKEAYKDSLAPAYNSTSPPAWPVCSSTSLPTITDRILDMVHPDSDRAPSYGWLYEMQAQFHFPLRQVRQADVAVLPGQSHQKPQALSLQGLADIESLCLV